MENRSTGPKYSVLCSKIILQNLLAFLGIKFYMSHYQVFVFLEPILELSRESFSLDTRNIIQRMCTVHV